jgi:hypothetical protein
MPSVDPNRNSAGGGSIAYPTSPPGPPPPGRGVDSPDRQSAGPPLPSSYGYGPPPGYGPPSSYYPMGPPPSSAEKSGMYGQYPPPPTHGHHAPPPYSGYGNGTTGGYIPYPYSGARSGPWMSSNYDPSSGYYSSQPPPSSAMRMSKEPPPSPSQHRGRSTRGGHGPSAGAAPSSYVNEPLRPSNVDDSNKSHMLTTTASSTSSPPQSRTHHLPPVDVDLERTKAAAVVELGISEVTPIQTDFHFFVLDHKDKLFPLAIAEVDKCLEGKSAEFIQKHRTFLIHSNLNCRLLKAWEDLPRVEREDYFKKEEDDRQRFMEEDEVVSRHCFTLTARVRSPTKSKALLQYQLEEEDGADGEEEDEDNGDAEDGDHELIDEDKEGKRIAEEPVATKEDSPSKKNKTESEQ